MLFIFIRDHWLLVGFVVFIGGILWGFYEAATANPADNGWDDLPTQSGSERLLRSIDGTGRTSVQIRKKSFGVEKKVR